MPSGQRQLLLQMCGLPTRVIEDARRIREKILSRAQPRTALAKPQEDLHTRWDIDTTPTRQSSYEMVLEPKALRRGLTPSSDISEVLLYTARTRLMLDVAARLAPLLTIGTDLSRLHMARSQLQSIRDEYAPQLAALGLTAETITQMLEEAADAEEETPHRTVPVINAVDRVIVEDDPAAGEGIRLFDDEELEEMLVSRGDLSCAQVQKVFMDASTFAESVLTANVQPEVETLDIPMHTSVIDPCTVEAPGHIASPSVSPIPADVSLQGEFVAVPGIPSESEATSANKSIDDVLFDAFF
jgi:hypothetical protein